MRNKWKGTLILFVLIGILSLITGSLVMYRTYEIDQMNGSTTVMGRIVDVSGDPLKDVEVSWEGVFSYTDDNGEWRLSPVDEGLIKLDIYKPGYVFTRIKWLVYPLSEIGDKLRGSPNDISSSFDIELEKEVLNINNGVLLNDTVNVRIFLEEGSKIIGDLVTVNGVERSGSILEEGMNIIEVDGNGAFEIGLKSLGTSEDPPVVSVMYPPGNFINISDALMEMTNSNSDVIFDGGDAWLNIIWDVEENIDRVDILIQPLVGNDILTEDVIPKSGGELRIDLDPGIYFVKFQGKEFKDMDHGFVYLNNSEVKTLNIQVDSNVEELLDLIYEPNYIMGITNIILGVLVMVGGILFKKRMSWGVVIILSIIGFLTFGPFQFILNINHILTIILVISLIRKRKEYNERRRFIRKAKRITA